jgi:hypothetical protein
LPIVIAWITLILPSKNMLEMSLNEFIICKKSSPQDNSLIKNENIVKINLGKTHG